MKTSLAERSAWVLDERSSSSHRLGALSDWGFGVGTPKAQICICLADCGCGSVRIPSSGCPRLNHVNQNSKLARNGERLFPAIILAQRPLSIHDKAVAISER